MRTARDALCLALDVPLDDGVELARLISAHVGVVKVGVALFTEHGPSAVERFLGLGYRVFLDLKLHDIPNTMRLAARHAAKLGVHYLTVHSQAGTAGMRAAIAGAAEGSSTPPTVLAVTVLTSMADSDVRAIGYAAPTATVVGALGKLAHDAGVGGIVCSPAEATAMALLFGPGKTICTPGIRLAGSRTDDQSRIAEPGAAIAQGATLLVVGRPLSEAKDPSAAAAFLHTQVEAALAARAQVA